MIRTTKSRVFFILDLMIIYGCFLAVFFYYAGYVTIPYKAALLMGFVAILWFFISTNSAILNLSPRTPVLLVLRDMLVAYSVLSAGVIATVGIFGNFRDNDKIVLYALLLAVFVSTAYRLVALAAIRQFVRKGYHQKSVLLIGGGRVAEKVIRQVQRYPELGYRLYGVLADNYHESLPKELYLGDLDRFAEIVRSGSVDEVFIAMPMKKEDVIACMVAKCEHEGVRARIVPDFYRITKSRIVLDELGSIPLISVRREPLSLFRNRIVKRTFDIAFSMGMLIVLSPVLVFLAVLVKLTSRGPVLFRQKRVGINNQMFHMYKFRTMSVQPERASDTLWTKPNDERVTTVGRFMRRANLDELPQFWNVLVGDMSVVGPRPEREHFVEQFKEEIPNYKVRHLVKSGITGLAQVNGWRGDTSIAKRVECDIHYLENWSFWMDMKIVVLTLFSRDTHKHAY